MNVNEGDVLAGKYRIERVLGRGAMGVVVAATHLQLERRVAVKFLIPEAVGNPENLARFAREARAAARLRSEHVTRVIDVGTLDSGAPYMVMEYLEGSDLAGHMVNHGPLTTNEAVELIVQACEALAEAHSVGIVHRDLKPANLFLARYPDGSPCLKILDFGISKVSATSGQDFDMTQTTAVMGTPLYMSPEQMRSTRAVDARTDIWSLGVILYELVTGRVPFHASTLPQLCAMVLGEPPSSLREWRPGVAPEFEALVMRCLDKAPDRRFQSVGELARALAAFAPSHTARTIEGITRILGSPQNPPLLRADASATQPVGAPMTDASWGRTFVSRHRSRGAWFVATVVVLGFAALAWLIVGRSDTLTAPPSAASGAMLESPPNASGEPSAAADAPAADAAPHSTVPPARTASAAAAASASSSAPTSSLATTTTPAAPTPKVPTGKASKRAAAPVAAPPNSAPSDVPPRPSPLDGRL